MRGEQVTNLRLKTKSMRSMKELNQLVKHYKEVTGNQNKGKKQK